MFDSASSLWTLWHPRTVVAVASLLHFVLGIFGVFRNHTYSPPLKLVCWVFFILADMVSFAQFVFPFIVSSKIDHWLISVWTAFFIRYLGGTDTFTAFSLEDNELWLRRALRATIFCLGYGFVIFQCYFEGMLPMFSIAVTLIIVIGIRSCVERVLVHKLGTKSVFRSSSRGKDHRRATPDFLGVRDKLVALERSGLPAIVVSASESRQQLPMWSPPSSFSSSEKSTIQMAMMSYQAHKMYRGLYMDHRYNFEERRSSRESPFVSVPSDQAFEIAYNQIRFVSEELHSKALLVQTKWGLVSRLCDIAVLFYSLICFIISVRHHGFPLPDIIVTYMVILMEILKGGLALYWLVISPRNIVQLINSEWSRRESLVKVMLKLLPENPEISIGQIDLFQLRLYNNQPSHFQRFVRFFFPREESENYLLAKRVNINDHIQDTTCRVLKDKSKMAEAAGEYESFNNSTGEWALKQKHCPIVFDWSVKRGFSDCTLTWTIATALLYHGCQDLRPSNELKTAKCFSDYFLYLVRARTGVLSSVADDVVNMLEDAFSDMERFLVTQTQSLNNEGEASRQLLSQNTDYFSRDVMGDGNESVFWDGVKLAKELFKLSSRDRDEILCEVWVELLSYAATHCSGEYHLQLLPHSIELLSVVWLIAFKLGLGQQYKFDGVLSTGILSLHNM